MERKMQMFVRDDKTRFDSYGTGALLPLVASSCIGMGESEGDGLKIDLLSRACSLQQCWLVF